MTSPRFLIVRFSAIGDCVLAAWAATAIRNRFPNAYICWAVESRCAPVIDTTNLVDEIAEVPRERWRGKERTLRALREQLAICSRLRQKKFDVGIDLQGHLKTAVCLRLACPRRRIASEARDFASRVLNPLPRKMPPSVHYVDWHHQVLQEIGEFELPRRPIMPPAPPTRDRLVTISTSAGHPAKVYPAVKWRVVAQGLQDQGWHIAFLGAPGDPMVDLPGTENLVGRLSLAESMAMVASSSLHLAGDTGTGHMAAAYGVPVVSVFGHMDPAKYRPYTERGRVIKVSDLAADVDPEDVLIAATELMRSDHLEVSY